MYALILNFTALQMRDVMDVSELSLEICFEFNGKIKFEFK
jgi:hypothetical protein